MAQFSLLAAQNPNAKLLFRDITEYHSLISLSIELQTTGSKIKDIYVYQHLDQSKVVLLFFVGKSSGIKDSCLV